MRVVIKQSTPLVEELVEVSLEEGKDGEVWLIDNSASFGRSILKISEKGIWLARAYGGSLPATENKQVVIIK